MQKGRGKRMKNGRTKQKQKCKKTKAKNKSNKRQKKEPSGKDMAEDKPILVSTNEENRDNDDT